MHNIVLETARLVHTYPGGTTALKGVDLQIRKGEQVSIIGQNGSGKTTMVRHFNGLLRPTDGKVFVDGQDTKDFSIGQLSKKVGYVFQNPNHQIFCTTVQEELEVGPKNLKLSKDDYMPVVERVIDLLDLKPILTENPLLLDYTTKKMVTLGSVLVFNPDVLIMDEPTGGLDEGGRQLLRRITQLLQDEGHTLLMISHDMDYVAEHSQRIIVMAEGQIIDDGTPKDIFGHIEQLRSAKIEAPQITQLDTRLDPQRHNLSLSVSDFVNKFQPNWRK